MAVGVGHGHLRRCRDRWSWPTLNGISAGRNCRPCGTRRVTIFLVLLGIRRLDTARQKIIARYRLLQCHRHPRRLPHGYTNLRDCPVQKGQSVDRGTFLGHVRGEADTNAILHFEVWKVAGAERTVDPRRCRGRRIGLLDRTIAQVGVDRAVAAVGDDDTGACAGDAGVLSIFEGTVSSRFDLPGAGTGVIVHPRRLPHGLHQPARLPRPKRPIRRPRLLPRPRPRRGRHQRHPALRSLESGAALRRTPVDPRRWLTAR